MENDTNNPVTESIKKEGDLIRNTGKNSVKTVKEETAKSAETITDRMKREGDLQRNSGKHSVRSLKETININFDKFAGVFEKIDKNIAKQTGIATAMIKRDSEEAEDQKQREQYDSLGPKVTRPDGSESRVEAKPKGDKNAMEALSTMLTFLGLGGLLTGGLAGAAKMLGAGGIAYLLRGPIAEFVSGAAEELLDRANKAVESWDFSESSDLVKKVGGWLKDSIGGILSDDNSKGFADGLGTFVSWYFVGRMFSKRFGMLLGGIMLAKDYLPFEQEGVNEAIATVGGILALYLPKIIGKALGKMMKATLAAAGVGALLGAGGKDKDDDKDKDKKDKPKRSAVRRGLASGVGSLFRNGGKLIGGVARVAGSAPAMITMGMAMADEHSENLATQAFENWRVANPNKDKIEYAKENPNLPQNYYDAAGIDMDDVTDIQYAPTKRENILSEVDRRQAMIKAEKERQEAMPSKADIERKRLVHENNQTLAPTKNELSDETVNQAMDDISKYLKSVPSDPVPPKTEDAPTPRKGEVKVTEQEERKKVVEEVNKAPSFMSLDIKKAVTETSKVFNLTLPDTFIDKGGKSQQKAEEFIKKSEKSSAAPSNVVVRGGDNVMQGGSNTNVTNVHNYHSSDKASQLDGGMIPFAQ